MRYSASAILCIFAIALLVPRTAGAAFAEEPCEKWSSMEPPVYATPETLAISYDESFPISTKLHSRNLTALGDKHTMRPMHIKGIRAMRYDFPDYYGCRGVQVFVYASHFSHWYSLFVRGEQDYRKQLRVFLKRVRMVVPEHFSDENICTHIKNVEQDPEGDYFERCAQYR